MEFSVRRYVTEMRRNASLCALFAALTALFAPNPASADELNWSDQWPRFRVSEGISTGVLFAGGAAIEIGLNPPERGNWRGPILLDGAARNAVAADSVGTAEAYGLASDITTGTMMAYPFVADVGLVALALRRSPPVALQIGLLGAESFAASTFLMTAGKFFIARQRPPSPDCSREGDHNLYCSEERFESFPSGHTTYAFTGASYICAVHEHLDLYGAGVAERIPCWAGIGVATVSGVSRMVSDNHYLSDVAAGAAIGFSAGYLMPKILHFGWGTTAGQRGAARPFLVPKPNGLAVTGTF